MVTITRHFFIYIFRAQNFSAAKFYMDYEKSMSFLVIPISPKVGENFENRLGSFKAFDSSAVICENADFQYQYAYNRTKKNRLTPHLSFLPVYPEKNIVNCHSESFNLLHKMHFTMIRSDEKNANLVLVNPKCVTYHSLICP